MLNDVTLISIEYAGFTYALQTDTEYAQQIFILLTFNLNWQNFHSSNNPRKQIYMSNYTLILSVLYITFVHDH